MAHRYSLIIAAFAAASIVVASTAEAQPTLQTRDVITELDTPWEILWGPDGWIWMTERGGRVSRVEPATGELDVLLTLTDVHEQGESGLLGMALHPSFADTPHVYIVYNYSTPSGIAEKLVRYRYDGQQLVEPSILLQNIPGYPTHDGSRLLVTPDRKLLMTTGDAQNQPAAQSHTQIVGKILRLNLDGTPPADNPWPAASYPTNYLWTTGHRNPQGLTVAPDGTIYSSEHGPNNDDEINIIERARNYGWPNVHGFCNLPAESTFCADSNVVEPIRAWTPTLATAGIEYYDHTAIPAWRHSLLLVNLKESDLRQLKLSADGRQIVSETTFFNGTYGRLRDIAVAPDGRVFIATSNHDGRATGGFPRGDDDRIVEIRGATASGATISAPEISPDTIRAGAQIQIEFTATGPFTVNNVFTVQLSDATGSFSAPLTLGTLDGLTGGIVTTTLSCDVEPGSGYRVRVVSSSPAETSPLTGIVIHASPAPVVTPSEGEREVCLGEGLQLGITGGTNAHWSPATGLSCVDCEAPIATPATTTSYTVTLTNELGCDVSDTIVVIVNPLPAPTITRNGNTLSAPEGFVSYVWLDAQTGAELGTSRTLTLTGNGSFVVRVTDSNGCVGTSDPAVITDAGGIVDEARDRDLRIAPAPARELIVVELALRRAGSVDVAIVDMRGAVVSRLASEAAHDGEIRAVVDLSALPAGVYVVRITGGSETWARPIVKQ